MAHLKMLGDFYVYAWLRPCGTPFYIGKGRGSRDREPKKNRIFTSIVNRLRDAGTPPTIKRLHEWLSEDRAFDLERAEIAKLGRLDNGTGILANQTDGGEGIAGWERSDEWRQKVRVANTGKTHSLKTRLRLSELRRGKRAAPQARIKMSEAQVTRFQDPAERERLSAIHRKRLSTGDARAVLREAMSRPETRAKLSAAARLRSDSAAWKESMRGLNATPQARAKNALSQLVKPPRSITGFKGVTKSGSKWRAKIVTNGRVNCLGTFETIEAAARAYDVVARELSDRAWLNFPEGIVADEPRYPKIDRLTRGPHEGL